MGNRRNERKLMLARVRCRESMIIYGRKPNEEADHCFEAGKEYLFCYDAKRDEIFTYNDVNEMHFLSLSDYYTDKHFELVLIADATEFGLDEVTLMRFKRMFKDRHNYAE
ncbi:hypothetical protein G7L40_20595 [Paenibacillus polymyxa]|uniref:hypothetical protein n=1 Tax=Paenibacillus polymyxa TaxID=1406 RepID=UPI000375A2B5|nr:hypothetical protein [Paenibacillus polymyxa]MBE7896110.1 hypothetical protein [Paenibacillus polymyxa]MCC3256640.1 hypothetical protein [Paenibacillus polymyxa]QPK54869.1 hypothetical protein G7035_20640 [Paenibacillus polymyxa]QPK59959.1 hypothetical protein G7L40_20595 [Paenibacillus polymyxa]UOD84451.1 hypothetical protein CUU60_04255 [Paenibacillus polymyxa ATCC 842]